MSGSVRLSAFIPAPPAVVYQAWLNGRQHAAMTGAAATSQARVGGKFTAWNGYIFGEHQQLVPSRRIVQSWRTTEFPGDCPDSRLEVEFAPEGDGTRLTLVQSELPAGEAERYHAGWQQFYFEPIQRYFARLGLASAAGSEPLPQPVESPPKRRRIVVGTAASMVVSAPQPVRRDRRRAIRLVEASPEMAIEEPVAELTVSTASRRGGKPAARKPRKTAAQKPAPRPKRPRAAQSPRKPRKTAARKPAPRPKRPRAAQSPRKPRKTAARKPAPRPKRPRAAQSPRKPRRPAKPAARRTKPVARKTQRKASQQRPLSRRKRSRR